MSQPAYDKFRRFNIHTLAVVEEILTERLEKRRYELENATPDLFQKKQGSIDEIRILLTAIQEAKKG